jgi:hypothetical protein
MNIKVVKSVVSQYLSLIRDNAVLDLDISSCFELFRTVHEGALGLHFFEILYTVVSVKNDLSPRMKCCS